jgi:integrative and conjugative element protein (TIGR02256 family)
MGEQMLGYYELAEGAFRFILAECSRKYPKETGGMLIGRSNGDCVRIEHATGPGPRARHSAQSFKRDGDYSQRILDRIVAESGGEYDYVGEWHSHPAQHGPSAKDSAAMCWIADNTKYAIDQPVLGLCAGEAKGMWRLRVYLFDGHKLRELEPHQ